MRFELFTFVLVLLVCVAEICSGYSRPFAEAFSGYQGVGSYYGNNQGYYGGPHSAGAYYGRDRRGSNRRSGRTYSDIARVVNPQPYAFVGARPFPGQPFNPIG
ncbi:uncharacterized protein LOC129235564 [Anastrepha obliqua]|uniref:uncharacterized protein LOC128855997 n=1 Tax=Anastrepha ludens TaxID=28586 RepID=UPI0023B17453|nr:uncharacterized protein LOC128855997 [Anastrepha ludens]XP_054725440.1 uncharacterized protein LOC129235564 [Anastrepha obliqua]